MWVGDAPFMEHAKLNQKETNYKSRICKLHNIEVKADCQSKHEDCIWNSNGEMVTDPLD